ncbi:MAG: ABC transporter permease [Candidatus Bipolaricaulota bacterium]|nr:ABC transporter permease [Candidatus Bipolaricaulota bacterium]MDW8126159.1 ABC transporter permease [Candidatus Bipolaricaulota bacterium]
MKLIRDLFRDYRFAVSFAVLFGLVSLAICSAFSPYDPRRWYQVPRDQPPSSKYVLGTNSKGQDVFWEATFAIRNSLVFSLIAASLSRAIAILLGLIAGYLGGWPDRTLTFLTDTFLVMPLFLFIVLLSMLLKGRLTLGILGVLLGFFGWAWDARVIRSQVLSLREREFTKTALLSGMPTLRLVTKEYIPHVLPIIFSTLINNMSWAIGMEITLAILGLLKMDIPTLGVMLRWAISYQALLLGYWWWYLTPTVLSILLFISLYWLSASVSEYLDPRSRLQRVGVR